MICGGDLRVTMTRDYDLRVSPRRLSVAGLYLRGHQSSDIVVTLAIFALLGWDKPPESGGLLKAVDCFERVPLWVLL